MIRLIIADDHQMFIDGLKILLQAETDINIVAVASNGSELIQQVNHFKPDIVLMDISMPEVNGIQASQQIKKTNPNVRILAVTMYNNREFVLGLHRIGVDGYIVKNTGKEELLEAVRTVASGKPFFTREIAEIVLREAEMALQGNVTTALTRREIEIVKLLSNGHSAKEIAAMLCLSTMTIETHRRNMLHKVRVKNVPELVKYAAQSGLL
jgi:two-component system nitrate/nitrite response regulator NarL